MADGKLEDKLAGKIVDAEELSQEFKEHSVAEFFKKNKQMLGLYGKVRTLTTIVHEYVTNSLDACEEANILPDIDVKLDEIGSEYYEVTVKDNGPGLTEETVGKALGKLLAGTKFHRMMQSRGQQGIGSAGCTMLSQMTTGKPVKVITGTGNKNAISLELTIDPKRNEPKIGNQTALPKDFRGLAVQAKFKGILYRDSEQGPLEYLRRTAIANPHAQISFRDPSGQKIKFKRTVNKVPERAKVVKPHPKGVSVDEIVTLAKYT
ncbi:MAG: DNA topoisomerase VI subunit B, partial [archaeon]|nr:DNA topoisomerase VI subunit B [archaeon]